jgi:hypothetical protein
MKNSTHQLNWIIDTGLFAGFWIASMLDLTGLAVHQWLGIAVGILAGYHFLAHWTWVRSVTQRWFGRTSGQARRFYLIDAGLFAGFSLILLTGLVISTWFDVTLENYSAWRNLHVTATVLTLGLIVVKIGSHQRWIVNIGHRILQPAAQPARPPPALQHAPAQVNTERRDFLKLMGIVSVAALVAAYNALESEDSKITQRQSATQEPSQSAYALEGDGNSTSSSQCWVQCNRGCSFPGHCRRYVDANQNNRCDLGECV